MLRPTEGEKKSFFTPLAFSRKKGGGGGGEGRRAKKFANLLLLLLFRRHLRLGLSSWVLGFLKQKWPLGVLLY